MPINEGFHPVRPLPLVSDEQIELQEMEKARDRTVALSRVLKVSVSLRPRLRRPLLSRPCRRAIRLSPMRTSRLRWLPIRSFSPTRIRRRQKFNPTMRRLRLNLLRSLRPRRRPQRTFRPVRKAQRPNRLSRIRQKTVCRHPKPCSGNFRPGRRIKMRSQVTGRLFKTFRHRSSKGLRRMPRQQIGSTKSAAMSGPSRMHGRRCARRLSARNSGGRRVLG